MTTPDRNDARALANAAFVGWLALVAVNAVFARRVPTVLDLGQSVLHHLYDAGQPLVLGALSWVVVPKTRERRPRPRRPSVLPAEGMVPSPRRFPPPLQSC